MTTNEFSNEFDILVDSYRRFKVLDNQAVYDSIEFDEYEKSIFLTKAQEDIVLELYKGYNSFSDSFEKTEELRRYLQSLIVKTPLTLKESNSILNVYNLTYDLPEDLWFIVSESFVKDSISKLVIPISHDNIQKVLENPFKRPSSKRVLRMDYDNKIVILSNTNNGDYTVSYIEKLSPIILIDLPDDLSINGKSVTTECQLNDILHKRILERAVALALQSKITASNKND